MNEERLDAKRLKLLKTTIVKLREVANLLDQLNINELLKYSCPVLGVNYLNSGDEAGKIVVHFASVETMQQIHKPMDKKQLNENYNELFYDTGKLRLIALEERKKV